MTEDSHEDPVRVYRIDDDLRYLLAVAQSQVHPRLSAVGGLVDPIAGGKVGALQPFTGADVDDARIGWRNGDRSDRARGLIVEDRVPGSSVIGGLEHPTIHRPDVEDVRLLAHAGRGLEPTAAEGSDVPPLHFAKDRGIEPLCLGRGCDECDGEDSWQGEMAHVRPASE